MIGSISWLDNSNALDGLVLKIGFELPFLNNDFPDLQEIDFFFHPRFSILNRDRDQKIEDRDCCFDLPLPTQKTHYHGSCKYCSSDISVHTEQSAYQTKDHAYCSRKEIAYCCSTDYWSNLLEKHANVFGFTVFLLVTDKMTYRSANFRED